MMEYNYSEIEDDMECPCGNGKIYKKMLQK